MGRHKKTNNLEVPLLWPQWGLSYLTKGYTLLYGAKESVPGKPKPGTMGASLWETGPFACSCLPFPGPQRPIKGTLMRDDKRQKNAFALCLCQPMSHCPQLFFFFLVIRHSSSFLCHRLMQFDGLKVHPDCSLEMWRRAATMNLNICVIVCCLQLPNSGISTPNLYYLFVFSQGLETVTLRMMSHAPIWATVPLPISRVLIENKICIMRRIVASELQAVSWRRKKNLLKRNLRGFSTAVALLS